MSPLCSVFTGYSTTADSPAASQYDGDDQPLINSPSSDQGDLGAAVSNADDDDSAGSAPGHPASLTALLQASQKKRSTSRDAKQLSSVSEEAGLLQQEEALDYTDSATAYDPMDTTANNTATDFHAEYSPTTETESASTDVMSTAAKASTPAKKPSSAPPPPPTKPSAAPPPPPAAVAASQAVQPTPAEQQYQVATPAGAQVIQNLQHDTPQTTAAPAADMAAISAKLAAMFAPKTSTETEPETAPVPQESSHTHSQQSQDPWNTGQTAVPDNTSSAVDSCSSAPSVSAPIDGKANVISVAVEQSHRTLFSAHRDRHGYIQ